MLQPLPQCAAPQKMMQEKLDWNGLQPQKRLKQGMMKTQHQDQKYVTVLAHCTNGRLGWCCVDGSYLVLSAASSS